MAREPIANVPNFAFIGHGTFVLYPELNPPLMSWCGLENAHVAVICEAGLSREIMKFVCNWVAKSREILMFVCLQKDATNTGLPKV